MEEVELEAGLSFLLSAQMNEVDLEGVSALERGKDHTQAVPELLENE